MAEDQADRTDGQRPERYDPSLARDAKVVVHHITGAFFFGAAANVGAVLDRIGETPRAYVLDFSSVPFLDSTAASTIEVFVRKAERMGAIVDIAGARPAIRRTLLAHGVKRPRARFHATMADALSAAREAAA